MTPRAIRLSLLMVISWACFNVIHIFYPSDTSGPCRKLVADDVGGNKDSSACLIPETVCAMKNRENHLWHHIWRYDYTINVPCEKKNGPFLLVLVISDPKDFPGRSLFRMFCGSVTDYLGYEIKTVFFVGRSRESHIWNNSNIIKESALFKDMIQVDFVDSFQNITLKTVLAFRWVTEHCHTARFVLRCGHDVFINYKKVALFLWNIYTAGSASKLFIGYRHKAQSPVWRSPRNKYYQTYDQYSLSRYPEFIAGWASIFSYDVIYLLHWASLGQHLFIEDVFMSVAAKEHGIQLIHNGDFLLEDKNFLTTFKSGFHIKRRNKCRLRHAFAIHGVQQTLPAWRFLNNTIYSDEKRVASLCTENDTRANLLISKTDFTMKPT